MYNLCETNKKVPSYYTIRGLYRRSSNKRLNLQFKIYDNLQQEYFEKVVSGNKSIVYDNVHIILEEFQLQNLSDEQLWEITVITWEALKKKYNTYMYIGLNETFKEVEKYLKKEKINYGRLRKYGRPSDSQSEITNLGFGQRTNS
jgi:hypothetical protein|nr:MAG TPA: hypothetical protein [Caudoviricetes sp.]